jgi:hypothetical protein
MTQAEIKALKREEEAKKNKQKSISDLAASGKLEDASKKAEEDLTDMLFEPEVDISASCLKSVKDYTSFGKKVGDILY